MVFLSFDKIKKGDKRPPFILMFILVFNINFIVLSLVELIPFTEDYIKEIFYVISIVFCNTLTKVFNRKFLDNKLTTIVYENIMRGFILFIVCFSIYEKNYPMATVQVAVLIGTCVNYSVDKPNIKKTARAVGMTIGSTVSITILCIVIDKLSIISNIPWYVSIIISTIIFLVFILFKRKRSKLMILLFSNIKRAKTKDARVLAELAIQMWSNHTLEELESDFKENISKEGSVCFIKFDEETPIGFAQCQLRHDYVEGTHSSPVGYLEGIFIVPKYRHKGYAKELLQKCELWAKAKGCSEFASDCELDNTDSFNFHMAMKFEEANRIICLKKEL